MNYHFIIEELAQNNSVFKGLLADVSTKDSLWKQTPEKWSLLEIVCHLHDEEVEDFRTRTKHLLENNKHAFTPINPAIWVKERNYFKEDYSAKLHQFIDERNRSVQWLKSLKNANWDNFITHQHFGEMTAKLFLSNWLAHDYLHIRQILKLKFDLLKFKSEEALIYAGKW